LSSALDYGGLALLRDAWERFGFGEAFADVPQARQRRLLQILPAQTQAKSRSFDGLNW